MLEVRLMRRSFSQLRDDLAPTGFLAAEACSANGTGPDSEIVPPECNSSRPKRNVSRGRQLDLARWEQLPDSTQLTIAEVAEILRISLSQVRNAIRAGRLKANRFGGKGKGIYRIEKRWIEEYKKNSLFQPTPGRREQKASRRAQVHITQLDEVRLRSAWRDAGVESDPQDGCRSGRQRE